MVEREKRSRSVVLNGVEIKEGVPKEAVDRIWKNIGVQSKIEEIKEIGK